MSSAVHIIERSARPYVSNATMTTRTRTAPPIPIITSAKRLFRSVWVPTRTSPSSVVYCSCRMYPLYRCTMHLRDPG